MYSKETHVNFYYFVRKKRAVKCIKLFCSHLHLFVDQSISVKLYQFWVVLVRGKKVFYWNQHLAGGETNCVQIYVVHGGSEIRK